MLRKFNNVSLQLFIISLLFIIIYFVIFYRYLQKNMRTIYVDLTVSVILIILIIVFIFITLLCLLAYGIGLIPKFKIDHNIWMKRFIFFVRLSLSLFITFILFGFGTQLLAYTPPILDENGDKIRNSIAVLERIKLGNTNQYITIRGKDQEKSILLFLAGGPGGSQLAATRSILSDLEDDFIVVNWDQPGSAKSFLTVPRKSITIDRYISDAHELTNYLQERFNQEKIYIVGQSWGSALAILLAQKYPEDYYAVIGAGQMVAFIETEIYCYNKALEIALAKADSKLVKKLKAQGAPPYYKEISLKSANYLMYLYKEMLRNPNINHNSHNTITDISGSEYGVFDKINYFIALYKTFDHVYPQLYDYDLRIDASNIEVPVYILHGKYDLNAPIYLVQDYFTVLNAPYKELICFEHSGHDLWIDESELFIDTIKYILNNENIM